MPAQVQKQPESEKQVGEAVPKREAEKDLFSWKAPARPFKRRDREFWVTVVAIAAISGLILFIIEGIMPVILIIAVLFLYYIMSTVEPETIEYKITNRGVKIADRTTQWELLNRFWFTKRLGVDLLIFEMITVPGRLEFVVNAKDKEQIKKSVMKYIPLEEAAPTNLDKAANWFSKKLPNK
jgi:hypothetical protein